MTHLVLCTFLRFAAPQSVVVMDFVATDPCLRVGVRVRLGANACHYLRTETWTPAHPKSALVRTKRRRR